MYRLIIIIFFVLIYHNISAQELKCRVQIISTQIQGTNKEVFKAMQTAIYEFMNNTIWTNHVYSNDERIECNILFNLSKQISADEFKGTIQIQSSRPVFNSSYNSVLFNHLDNDFQFKFIEQEVLEFNENAHSSNLTSVLAFYTYIILGLDYDSFSLEGGTQYFQKAENIVNNAQSARESGWKAYESRKNRYWLIENIINNIYSPIHEFSYNYHRLGLDIMSDKANEGRAIIAESLKLLQQIHRKKPGSFILQILFNAKVDEIVKIFSESYPDEKRRVYNILKEIDPANITKYEAIIK
ncbi:MAG: DUF4835 family protein [Bacteroidales bacterium]|nr:DUF4835 family protein [Bacteroidales bacterium]